MKRTKIVFRIVYALMMCILMLGVISCNKSDSSNSNTSMSATVAGNAITFTTTLSNSNGYTILQGSNSKYSLTITMKSLAASIYVLGDQSTGYYATVTDNLGNTYSTDASNTGQATLTASGVRYNGTFYFTANETSPIVGGGNVTVTNGSFTNM